MRGNEIIPRDINPIATDFKEDCTSAPPLGRRGNTFREFTVVYHDEIKAVQALPHFDEDDPNNPALAHTLHSVRDGFAINYGTGGIGAEILANRLGVGPMGNCADCLYEEFFLSAWAVGDPAMVVDRPASTQIGADGKKKPDALPATMVLYPNDPSNVHHSYLNDHVKMRVLHAGPKEHHVHHLHAHQWLHAPDSDNSSYLESQAMGPGYSFTTEIAHGGTGNRNKTPGDSIFHCHFYPHFKQGMWELWRAHDVFDDGTDFDGVGDRVGAQITIQRWYVAPTLNLDREHRTLRTVFTHDHFGPSTHQQAGTYAGLVAEPEGSVWNHNETGQTFGGHLNGGPTLWQAVIETPTESYRELLMEFADYPLAYKNGGGANGAGHPVSDPASAHNNSGFRSSQAMGVSEHFEFLIPEPGATKGDSPFADYLYQSSASVDSQWNGAWGILRAYNGGSLQPDLLALPVNSDSKSESATNNQVRTPINVIGQHIHLVKFDVTSSDGAANGWNYEDGTFSPSEVQEQIRSLRKQTYGANAINHAPKASMTSASPRSTELIPGGDKGTINKNEVRAHGSQSSQIKDHRCITNSKQQYDEDGSSALAAWTAIYFDRVQLEASRRDGKMTQQEYIYRKEFLLTREEALAKEIPITSMEIPRYEEQIGQLRNEIERLKNRGQSEESGTIKGISHPEWWITILLMIPTWIATLSAIFISWRLDRRQSKEMKLKEDEARRNVAILDKQLEDNRKLIIP